MTSRPRIHKKGKLPFLDLLRYVKDKPNFPKVGALGMFIGVVRGETPSGETVGRLEVSAEEERANDVLERICRELVEREGVIDVQIHQFIGDFDVGENLVYVLVAGAHRSDVFPVLEEAVERYKREAPMIKKEYINQ